MCIFVHVYVQMCANEEYPVSTDNDDDNDDDYNDDTGQIIHDYLGPLAFILSEPTKLTINLEELWMTVLSQ